MPQLTVSEGYGNSRTVDTEKCAKLLNYALLDTDEIRRDAETALPDGCEYVGVAYSGCSVSSPQWYVMRKTFTNNKMTRLQFQGNIAWDNRSQGWI